MTKRVFVIALLDLCGGVSSTFSQSVRTLRDIRTSYESALRQTADFKLTVVAMFPLKSYLIINELRRQEELSNWRRT